MTGTRGAGGDVKPFMDRMATLLGEPKNLEDFCRKAQMLNYESHRAMFEGMNALLWKPSSGRLMWMSHPSWPSMAWQLYSSNYETAGAYFGVKKACEFLHVQMNLPNRRSAWSTTTLSPLPGARVIATIYDQNGRSGTGPHRDRSTSQPTPPGTCSGLSPGKKRRFISCD